MTLIVGIKCVDGVVLGADSAATYGTAFQSTIKQQTSKKLSIIGGQIVLGVSGPVGLAQSYASEIDGLLQNRGPKQRFKKRADAKKFFSEAMWKYAKPAWERANLVAQTAQHFALQEALHQSVAAFPVANETPCLLQFTHPCQRKRLMQVCLSYPSAAVSPSPIRFWRSSAAYFGLTSRPRSTTAYSLCYGPSCMLSTQCLEA